MTLDDIIIIASIRDLFGGVAFKFGSNPIKESWNKISGETIYNSICSYCHYLGGDYVKDISSLKDKLKLLKYQLYQVID